MYLATRKSGNSKVESLNDMQNFNLSNDRGGTEFAIRLANITFLKANKAVYFSLISKVSFRPQLFQ